MTPAAPWGMEPALTPHPCRDEPTNLEVPCWDPTGDPCACTVEIQACPPHQDTPLSERCHGCPAPQRGLGMLQMALGWAGKPWLCLLPSQDLEMVSAWVCFWHRERGPCKPRKVLPKPGLQMASTGTLLGPAPPLSSQQSKLVFTG